MGEKRIGTLKIAIIIYLIVQIVVSIEALRINNEYYEKYFQQKLLVKGEIVEMNYFNITYPNPNFNIIDTVSNITEHLYNLTIDNYLTNSIVYCSLQKSTIEKFNTQIGDIILIYKNPPFIKIQGVR